MDPDLAFQITSDRLRDRRRRAEATRTGRLARRTADHPSFRRRPPEGVAHAPG